MQQLRRGEVKLFQQHLRLVAELADARCNIGPLAQSVFQHGIGDCGDDRVRVGISVPGNIDGFHSTSEKIHYLYDSASPKDMRMICGSILVFVKLVYKEIP